MLLADSRAGGFPPPSLLPALLLRPVSSDTCARPPAAAPAPASPSVGLARRSSESKLANASSSSRAWKLLSPRLIRSRLLNPGMERLRASLPIGSDPVRPPIDMDMESSDILETTDVLSDPLIGDGCGS